VEESTQRMVRLNVAKCICTIITDVICTLKFISISTVTHCGDQMDHSRSLRTVISGLLSHWRHPHGRPRQSWTRTIEKDLSALSIGRHTAWRWAQDCVQWQQTMEAAVFQHGACPWWKSDQLLKCRVFMHLMNDVNIYCFV